MATDEIVTCLLVIDYQEMGVFIMFPGDGTFQETNAKVIVPAIR